MPIFTVILSHNTQNLPTRQFQDGMIHHGNDEDIRRFVSIIKNNQQWELSILAWMLEDHLYDYTDIPELLPAEFHKFLQTNSVLMFLDHLKRDNCITDEVNADVKSWVVNCHPIVAAHAITLGGQARNLVKKTKEDTEQRSALQETLAKETEDLKKRLKRIEALLSTNPQQPLPTNPQQPLMLRGTEPTNQPENATVAEAESEAMPKRAVSSSRHKRKMGANEA